MTRKKDIRVCLSSHRDLPLLRFLWKWKVVSTEAIACRFFPRVHVQTAYRRLQKLSKGGFIQCTADTSGHKFLWGIAKKGFETIRVDLPALDKDAFGSEHPGHDLLCAAAHLGDFLRKEPESIELFSEQQLRSYVPSELPDEFPKFGARRPDGYWYIHQDLKPRVIALEVELNSKSSSDYKTISLFYNRALTIDHVVWVVKDKTLENYIQSCFSQSVIERRNIHSFIQLSEFMVSGWSAKVSSGVMIGEELRNIICDKNQAIRMGIQGLYEDSTTSYSLKFLNLGRSYGNSTACARYQPRDFP